MKKNYQVKRILSGVVGICLAIYPTLGTFSSTVMAKEKPKEIKDEVAHVTTHQQLKNILENSPHVSHIILDNNVTVENEGSGDIDIKGDGRNVIIEGGGQQRKIHFSNRGQDNDNDIELVGKNQNVTFKNISFVNAGGVGAVFTGQEVAHLTFQNVEATGRKLVYGSKKLEVTLQGHIKANTTNKSIDVRQGKVTADTGADIDVFSKNNHAIDVGQFVAEKDSSVKARNEGTHNQAVFALSDSGGPATFKKGSSVDFATQGGNSLAMGSGAKGDFHIEGSPIATWDKEEVNSEKPSYSYPTTKADFTLHGWGESTVSEGSSNPPEFMDRFGDSYGSKKSGSANRTGRFATGKFVPNSMKETTINKLTTKSVKATGQAEPNSTVTIKAGGKEIGKGQAKSDGTYEIAIPKQAAGTVVTAQATLNNQTSNVASTTVTQADLAETTINKLTTDSVKATGQAEPNSTVTIKAGETKIGEGQAKGDGTYEITIPKQAYGTKVTAQAELNGKNSNVATTTVTQGKLAKTTINELTTDSVKATGQAEPNSTVTIKAGGREIGQGQAKDDGTYEITIPKQAYGTKVTAQAELNNVFSNEAETTVKRGMLEAPTIDPYYTHDKRITGTVPKGAKKIKLYVDGVHKRTGEIAEDSTYKIYGYDIEELKHAGKSFQVIAVDSDGRKGHPATGVVKELLEAPTINPYHLHDKRITGTVPKGAKKIKLYIDGKHERTGEIEGSTYEIYAYDKLTTTGKNFQVVAVDDQGREGHRALGVVAKKQIGVFTPSPIKPLAEYVTGAFTGNDVEIIPNVDDKCLR